MHHLTTPMAREPQLATISRPSARAVCHAKHSAFQSSWRPKLSHKFLLLCFDVLNEILGCVIRLERDHIGRILVGWIYFIFFFFLLIRPSDNCRLRLFTIFKTLKIILITNTCNFNIAIERHWFIIRRR